MPRKPSLKKKGAQPGNINAMRSGFYSRRYTPLELSDLETDLGDLGVGLSSEIVDLKIHIRRMMEMADAKDTSTSDKIGSLDALGSSYIRLASLIRTNDALKNRTNDILTVLNGVLTEVLDELGFKPPAGMARSDVK